MRLRLAPYAGALPRVLPLLYYCYYTTTILALQVILRKYNSGTTTSILLLLYYYKLALYSFYATTAEHARPLLLSCAGPSADVFCACASQAARHTLMAFPPPIFFFHRTHHSGMNLMASARRAALRQHKNARKRLLKGAGQGSGTAALSLSQQLQLPPVLPSDSRFQVGGGGGHALEEVPRDSLPVASVSGAGWSPGGFSYSR
jgi:hypothetical protein